MKKKVAVIYPSFPHFRKGIIDNLKISDEFNYTFIGDLNSIDKSINKYVFDENDSFINVKSYRFGSFVFHPGLLRKLHTLESFDFYIFHSGPFWPSIYISAIFLRIRNKKTINWSHGILNDKSFKKKIFYSIFNLCFKYHFVYSNFSKLNMVNTNLFSEDNIQVIDNSLDYKTQIIYRNRLLEFPIGLIESRVFQSISDVNLVFIGRLNTHKKLNIILDIIYNLKKEKIKANLLLIGSGPDEERLIKIAEDYKIIDQINFYGPSYSEEEISKLIYMSDICISPGEVGLTAIHSMMYGTPVITHNDFNHQMPEVESIKHRVNGFLIDKNDFVNGCIKEIKRYNQLSDKDLKEIELSCFNTVDSVYNPTSQISKIENFLKNKI